MLKQTGQVKPSIPDKYLSDLRAGLRRQPTQEELFTTIAHGDLDEWEYHDHDIYDAVKTVEAMQQAKVWHLQAQAQPRSKSGMLPSGSAAARLPLDDRALSWLLADEAGRVPAVEAFRRRVLGGRLLSPDEVWPWLEKHLYGGSLAAGADAVDEGEPEALSPGYDLVAAGWKPVREQRFEPFREDNTLWIYSGPARGSLPLRMFVVPKRGPVRRLKHLGQRLAPIFGWDTAQAATFVLTGTPPLVETIEIQRRRGVNNTLPQRIELSVAVGTPPERVAAEYKKHRDSLLAAPVRTLSDRHLALVLFVVQNPELNGDRLFVAWNNEHPSWAYAHYPSLRRAINEARERLLDLYSLAGIHRPLTVESCPR